MVLLSRTPQPRLFSGRASLDFLSLFFSFQETDFLKCTDASMLSAPLWVGVCVDVFLGGVGTGGTITGTVRFLKSKNPSVSPPKT